MDSQSRQNLDEVAAQLALSQHGQVGVAQLVAAGQLRRLCAYRVAQGRWFRTFRGVVSVGRPAVTPLEWASAAVLACGRGAVLSHASALALWGAHVRWPAGWHVTVSRGNPRPPGITVHRCPGLSPRDMTKQLGVPVTSLARTVLDCAPHTPVDRVGRLVNDALVGPYLTERQLAEALGRYPQHPGRKLVVPFLDDERTRSDLEDLFLGFCRAYGLPVPECNVRVGGREVDALFRAERVIVELDSWRFHRHKHSFRVDRRKDVEALVEGFVTVRVTEDRISGDADREADRMRAILKARRNSGT